MWERPVYSFFSLFNKFIHFFFFYLFIFIFINVTFFFHFRPCFFGPFCLSFSCRSIFFFSTHAFFLLFFLSPLSSDLLDLPSVPIFVLASCSSHISLRFCFSSSLHHSLFLLHFPLPFSVFYTLPPPFEVSRLRYVHTFIFLILFNYLFNVFFLFLFSLFLIFLLSVFFYFFFSSSIRVWFDSFQAR